MKRSAVLFALPALLITACTSGSGGTDTPDTTGPQLSLTQSTSDENSNVRITANVSDTSGVAKVEFYQNGVLKATDTTAPYEYTVAVLNDDRTGFTAKAYDTQGNISTSAVFNVTTLNQGVWEWGIFDSADKLIDSGVAVYDDESVGTSGSFALGGYVNGTKTKSGPTALGNLSSAAALGTVFALTNDFKVGYFAGTDIDGKFSTETLTDGKSYTVFIGAGSTFDSSNNPVQNVGIVLLRTSAEVPKMPAARTATTIQRLAAQHAFGHLSAQSRPVNAAAILKTSQVVKR